MFWLLCEVYVVIMWRSKDCLGVGGFEDVCANFVMVFLESILPICDDEFAFVIP